MSTAKYPSTQITRSGQGTSKENSKKILGIFAKLIPRTIRHSFLLNFFNIWLFKIQNGRKIQYGRFLQ
jgi:hypothetical protein